MATQKRKSQAGEAEMGFFLIVVIICGLVSGTLLVLQWVRNTKNARLHGYADKKHIEVKVAHKYPGEFVAECQKPLWAALSTSMPCSIEPWSYPEKRLEEEELARLEGY